MKNVLVGIVMGSDSDLEIMSEAVKILDELGIAYEISILSAHRVPDEMSTYAKSAKKMGLKVLIAGAGGAAALPGSIAAQTQLPVIGVPIMTKSMEGLDSLLSIVQMPPGIPVATVGINAAKNAGLMAAQILAISDPKISKSLDSFRKKLKVQVLGKNTKLAKLGWKKYLKQK